jgi:vacuolar-type H+-ATPase subunit C/Vma6
LAHEPTPRQVVTHLVLLSHPDASRLLPLVAPVHPSWFELEVALLAGFVERSGAAASRDENLRDFVAQRVDLMNLATALLLASSGDGAHDAATCFVPGGRFVTKGLFMKAAASRAAGGVLVKGLEATPLEDLDAAAFGDPAQLEQAGLKLALAQQRRRFRIEPTGSAALMLYLLRLEAQSSDLFRIAWGVALGAPAALLQRTLVTP